MLSFWALNLDFYPIYVWMEPKLSQDRSAALQRKSASRELPNQTTEEFQADQWEAWSLQSLTSVTADHVGKIWAQPNVFLDDLQQWDQ